MIQHEIDILVPLRTFQRVLLICTLVTFGACTGLSDQKAGELVHLRYRQQSTTPGEGHWMLDTVVVYDINKVARDTFQVSAYVTGLYQLPVLEGTPGQHTEAFHDSVHFYAIRNGKVWIAKRWDIFPAE